MPAEKRSSRARPVLLDEEGESDWTVIGNFALNAARSAMAQITPRTGWQCWDMLRALCMDDAVGADRVKLASGSEIRIPVDVYRSFQITLKKSREKEMLGAIRVHDGRQGSAVPPDSGDPIQPCHQRNGEDREEFLIKPECRSDTFLFSPSQKIIDFARSVERGRVPSALRTKKRKPVLYEALFRALEAPSRKAAGEALKVATDEGIFGRRNSAVEARRLIRQSIDAFNAEDAHFLFTDHGWRLTSVDKKKEKLLFLVPFAAFGAALFERVTDDGAAMAVSEIHLLEHLHLLHSLAAEAGVELSFGDYPVESVDLGA